MARQNIRRPFFLVALAASPALPAHADGGGSGGHGGYDGLMSSSSTWLVALAAGAAVVLFGYRYWKKSR